MISLWSLLSFLPLAFLSMLLAVAPMACCDAFDVVGAASLGVDNVARSSSEELRRSQTTYFRGVRYGDVRVNRGEGKGRSISVSLLMCAEPAYTNFHFRPEMQAANVDPAQRQAIFVRPMNRVVYY